MTTLADVLDNAWNKPKKKRKVKKCKQCNQLRINGCVTHELNCPNSRKDEKDWV